MVFEMGLAQHALRRRDRRRGRFQAFRRHRAARELPVEIGLLLDQARAERHRLGLHGVEQALYLALLLRRKPELAGKLQHVRRTGIAVQLGGECKAHAAAGPEVADLLFGQRLDRARLHARIGRLCMRAGNGEDDRSNNGPQLHRMSP